MLMRKISWLRQTSKLNTQLVISHSHRLYDLLLIYRTVRQQYNARYYYKIECNFSLP